MSSYSDHCLDLLDWLRTQYYNASSNSSSFVTLNRQLLLSLLYICDEELGDSVGENARFKSVSKMEGKYSKPMVLIGIYISVASLFCILAMVLDLLYAFRNRKFWFPTKYFSLNAASITVITVAMKLPVDLTSPMPGTIDQAAKLGGLAYMCTMMCNLVPSLASMGNKSLLANIIGITILVITLIANVGIQLETKVITIPYTGIDFSPNKTYTYLHLFIVYIYMGMLLFLLMILISSAITIPTSKRILEVKYQATLNDQHSQENLILTVTKLRQLVKRYWIMAETGSPQFVMAGNPLSNASGIICAISMFMHISFVWELVPWHKLGKDISDSSVDNALTYESVYKWSMIAIVITQSAGIVAGSIAPIFRCFTLLSFKSFANQKRKHFLVFKVEKYWTQKLCKWKDSRISFLSSGRRSRAFLHSSKNRILSFCIVFQKAIVVSCKIIGLAPVVVIIFVNCCSCCFKSLKSKLLTTSTSSSSEDATTTCDDTNEDLSNYVLSLQDNTQLVERTMKGILNSMNLLIQEAEKKQHNNLLKLIKKSTEESEAFNGVVMFDNDQCQSSLPVEFLNSWSLPIITLTCIAVSIPNIDNDRVENLLESVSEGLLYTYLVEERLNKESVYVNIRRATVTLWREVEDKCKWLETTLERSAYEGKTTTQIITSFSHTAEEIVNEFNTSTTGEVMENENLPAGVIAANSMYRITKTIMHTYESNKWDIIEDELFRRLSRMIADILAACLTNIPRVIAMICQESAIDKREASVMAAIDLLGRTTKIIKILETRVPSMDQDKMAYIEEWRFHLRQP